MVAHVLGIPVEESVLQLAPAGAALVTAVAIVCRTTADDAAGRARVGTERSRPTARERPNGKEKRHAEARRKRLGERTKRKALAIALVAVGVFAAAGSDHGHAEESRRHDSGRSDD